MRRVLVFLNGNYADEAFYLNQIRESDFIICADGGMNFLQRVKKVPNLLVGDFDSINEEANRFIKENKVEIKQFPAEKNFTDGEFALEAAVSMKPDEIHIFGGFGDRRDHEYTNIAISEKHLDKNVPIYFADKSKTIFLVKNKAVINAKKGTTVSLLPVTETVDRITTTGLYYSMKNGQLIRASSRGVSNVVTNNPAIAEFKKGILKIIINHKV